MSASMLAVSDLQCGYAGKRILQDVSFTLGSGEFVGILGPNGTGKSTLLKTIARLQPPLGGQLRLREQPLSAYSARALAREIAFMPQHMPADEGWKVSEIVAMGRFPHQNGWAFWGGREDQAAISAALARTRLEALADRPMHTLSGGQRQRVYLARALAQSAPLLLLDEPTSHLDLNHQLEFFKVVQEVIAERRVTVVAVLHDLNLAAQFCNRLLVLKEGILLADGAPDVVLEPGLIEEAFGLQVMVRRHPETGLPYILPLQLNRRAAGASVGGGSGRLAGVRRGQLHVLCGGGSGERLLPELYRMGYELSVGIVNALDTDQVVASRLGLPVISEAPFSPPSADNLAILEAHLRRTPAVVVGNVAWGSGNIDNLRVLAALPELPRVYMLADQPVEARDFTGGEAVRLTKTLVERGARMLSEAAMLAHLRSEAH